MIRRTLAEEWEDLAAAAGEVRRAIAEEWARTVAWFRRPGPLAPGEISGLVLLLLALVLLATCEGPR